MSRASAVPLSLKREVIMLGDQLVVLIRDTLGLDEARYCEGDRGMLAGVLVSTGTHGVSHRWVDIAPTRC